MKKLFVLFLLTMVIILASAPVMAGGDKVRGENGEGEVTQTCITPDYSGDCPFGDGISK